MEQAVERAYEVASKDTDTLKIFVAPEFFWRGPKGSYPFDSIDNPQNETEFNAINEIGRGLENIIQQEKFSDWMFVFGTIVAAKESPYSGSNERAILMDGTLYQFLNFAPMYKGFDPLTTNSDGMKFIVPKAIVSNIDFLTEDRKPQPAMSSYDNVLLDEIFDLLLDNGYQVVRNSWLYMDNIAMSIEICLDHFEKVRKAYQWLHDPNVTMVPSGGLGEFQYLPKPDGAQISIVSSAGMFINKESLVLENGGTIILQDGLKAQLSEQQTCEFYEPEGKETGKWFCSERIHRVYDVYPSMEEAETALRGLFSIIGDTVPEIHLFEPLDIVSVGSEDVVATESPYAAETNQTTGDIEVTSNETDTADDDKTNTTADDSNTADDNKTNTTADDSIMSTIEDTSTAGKSAIKYTTITFALVVAFLL